MNIPTHNTVVKPVLNNSPEFDVSEAAPTLRTFKAYTSELPVTIPEGERMIKCLYRTDKKTGKAAGDNSYILVSESHLSEDVMIENAVKLAPYVAAYFQGVEDDVVKEHHKKAGKGFSDSFLSLSKILETLDSRGQSNRLNKEKIEAWFGSTMQEKLVSAFADRMGMDSSEEPTAEELEKLAVVTGAYRAKFASLASGKTSYRKEEAEALQKALDTTGAVESAIGARFYERLEAMKSVSSNDLLMAL